MQTIHGRKQKHVPTWVDRITVSVEQVVNASCTVFQLLPMTPVPHQNVTANPHPSHGPVPSPVWILLTQSPQSPLEERLSGRNRIIPVSRRWVLSFLHQSGSGVCCPATAGAGKPQIAGPRDPRYHHWHFSWAKLRHVTTAGVPVVVLLVVVWLLLLLLLCLLKGQSRQWKRPQDLQPLWPCGHGGVFPKLGGSAGLSWLHLWSPALVFDPEATLSVDLAPGPRVAHLMVSRSRHYEAVAVWAMNVARFHHEPYDTQTTYISNWLIPVFKAKMHINVYRQTNLNEIQITVTGWAMTIAWFHHKPYGMQTILISHWLVLVFKANRCKYIQSNKSKRNSSHRHAKIPNYKSQLTNAAKNLLTYWGGRVWTSVAWTYGTAASDRMCWAWGNYLSLKRSLPDAQLCAPVEHGVVECGLARDQNHFPPWKLWPVHRCL